MAEFFESQAARDVPFDGRRWSTQELRLKSFEDLHKLWFVLLKERNLLLTHMHYERSQNRAVPSYTRRMQMVKKSMGGIKRVISEREIALNMAKSAHGLAFKRTRIAAAAPERDDEKVRFQPLIEERTRIKAWQVKDKPSMAHLEEATEKTMSHLETIRAALGAHGRKLSLRQALLRGAAIATLQHVTGVPASAPASSPTSDTTTETTSQAPPPSTQP
ncbi:hypothetical protein, variant [Capsaspora owczarzaki ATCC 30864]|nr:hypothetical protein, variant [Capsaspora owczarzaki ATCC 30864]|eukprot:XP_011270582.1 hypothetical protein, variant [Capsaspora owczarzaki ATCC 30864]